MLDVELHAGGPPWTQSAWVWAILFLMAIPVVLFLLTLLLRPREIEFGQVQDALTRVMVGLVRAGNLALLGVACGAGALRAAASVAGERQRQTLDSLLTLPCGRGEILRAKWLGALWRGHGWVCSNIRASRNTV